MVSLERWLLVQQQKAGPTNADPLLPDFGGKKEPDQLLVAELLEAGAGRKESKRFCNYLGEITIACPVAHVDGVCDGRERKATA